MEQPRTPDHEEVSEPERSTLGTISSAVGLVACGAIALNIVFIVMNPIVFMDGMLIAPMLCAGIAIFASMVGLILGISGAAQGGHSRKASIRGIVLNLAAILVPIGAYLLLLTF